MKEGCKKGRITKRFNEGRKLEKKLRKGEEIGREKGKVTERKHL